MNVCKAKLDTYKISKYFTAFPFTLTWWKCFIRSRFLFSSFFDYFTTLGLTCMGIFKDIIWIYVKFYTFGTFSQLIRIVKWFLTLLKIPFEAALDRCTTLMQRSSLSIRIFGKLTFSLRLIYLISAAVDRQVSPGVAPLTVFLIIERIFNITSRKVVWGKGNLNFFGLVLTLNVFGESNYAPIHTLEEEKSIEFIFGII